nr:hypothetical protein [Streptomyces cellostaticus]
MVESHGGAGESVEGCTSAFHDFLIGHGSQYALALFPRKTREEDPSDRAAGRWLKASDL